MPLSAVLPYIPTILSAVGIGVNKITEDTNNYENIKAQERANLQARQWAVEDWNKQNAYNHPAQQMQRLREAGLNPNLVYGKGADNTAAVIKSSSNTPLPRQQAPIDTTGLNNSIMLGQQLRQNQANIDLQNAQTLKVLEEGRALKRINDQTEAVDKDTTGTLPTIPWLERQEMVYKNEVLGIDAGIKRILYDKNIQVNEAVEKVNNLIADTDLKKANVALAGVEKDKKIAEIEQTKANVKLMQTDMYSKILDQVYKKAGISNNDPMVVRIGVMLAHQIKFQDIINDINMLTEFVNNAVTKLKK